MKIKISWVIGGIGLILILYFLFDFFVKSPKFSELKPLSAFQQTVFLPTLEDEIVKDKNCIYSASLLYAVDEVKKEIGGPWVIDPAFKELQLLHDSKSHLNTLKPKEFKTWIEVSGKGIVAKAEFYKSLSFETKMIGLTKSLTFDKAEVSSFGMKKYDRKIAGSVNILNYQTDDDFIIKLIPKDVDHEIILFKTNLSFSSLAEILSEINKKIDARKDDLGEENSWRYKLKEQDKLIIPKLNFNIENNFKSLEGKRFIANKITYEVSIAYQSTAFLIDENGAEVKSHSDFGVKALSADPISPHPKKLILDKPFLLVLKRVDNKNPYFAMWVANAELMVKEN